MNESKIFKHDFMNLINYSINNYDKVFLNRHKVELDLIDSSNWFQSFIPTYDNDFIDNVNFTLGKWK